MEQRTATIPFDLETAKKINIGEIAGRIVTEKGQNRAEIVYEDNSSNCPLLVVIHSIKTKLLMKTLEQLKELTSKCLDGRDFNRLAKFVPYSMIKDFGMEPNEEYDNEEKWNSTVVEFTRENVLKQLEEDVRFGFEKALNQRGISASLMFECVMMWNYILEEGLESWGEDDYAFYGLPLFKATAVKYGWDNPIGEDSGRERKYDSQY